MSSGRMTILVVVAVVMAAGISFGQVHFNDGKTWEIDYEVDDSVHIDEGDAYAQTRTTLQLIEGGQIPWPWNYLRVYNQGCVSVDGGHVYQLHAHDATTVSMSAGDVTNLLAYNSSTVNISGGELFLLEPYDDSSVTVSGGEVRGTLITRDSSTLHISDGNIDSLSIRGDSAVNIAGGELRFISTSPNNNSTIDISAGHVQSLFTYSNAKVNVSGGQTDYLQVRDNGVATMSDGKIDELDLYDNSTVHISGGSITGDWGLRAFDSSTVDISGGLIEEIWAEWLTFITITGHNFELGKGLWLDGDELWGTGTLSGQWLDGTEWSTEIVRNDETATILLIPEPATVMLLGLGGLALRRRQR